MGAPTIGWGKTFWRVGRFFFTKTTVSLLEKVEKLIQRCVSPRALDSKKMDFLSEIRIFGPKIKRSLLDGNQVLTTPGQSCAKKKSTLFPNKYLFSRFRV